MLTTLLAVLVLLQPGNPAPAPGSDDPKFQINYAAVPAPRKDQWWIDRNNSFNARAKQGAAKGDIDIIFVGDSITQGWEQAGKNVWNTFYGDRQAVDFGIGGDRTQQVLYRVSTGNLDGLDTPDSGNSPRLVVLMIGTNNTAPDPTTGNPNTPAQINEGVRACVNAIHDKLPGTHILVLGIFPRGEKPDDSNRKVVAATNELLKSVGEGGAGEPAMANVHFLDISDRFIEKDGTISRAVMPDMLHLSEKGYTIWAEAIRSHVDKWAPKRADQ
ncbi:MAG: GDSL family lipase [Planctomycetes bacterium]|nr:GDSL family lipase [Planctomycetota bacterium]